MDISYESRISELTIFLDIDGVIVNEWSYFNVEGELNAESVTALNQLFDKFKSRIVVSSTWREMHTLAELKEILQPLHAQIVDVTLVLETRGQEISQWISQYPLSGPFLILDDHLFDFDAYFERENVALVENGYHSNAFTKEHLAEAMEKVNLQIRKRR